MPLDNANHRRRPRCVLIERASWRGEVQILEVSLSSFEYLTEVRYYSSLHPPQETVIRYLLEYQREFEPMTMTGLEVPGFIIGVSGLIPLIEKSLVLWQSISEAKGYGSDMMGLMAQLSMEYYKFVAWGRLSGALQQDLGSRTSNVGAHGHNDTSSSPSLVPKSTSSTFPFPDDFHTRLEAPIEDAVARVVALLADIVKITEKYKPVANPTSPSPARQNNSTSVPLGLSTVLPIFRIGNHSKLASAILAQQEHATKLQEKTSFRLRFTFSSKPWGKPDRIALEGKVQELCYWNNTLEMILPQALRVTLRAQALPGQLLVEENREILATLIEASKHQNVAVRTHAKLWKERLDFSGPEKPEHANTEKYRRSASLLGDIQDIAASHCQLLTKTFREGSSPPVPAVVEWYPFGSLKWDIADVKLATGRLAELVHLSAADDKPESLRALSSICFVVDAQSLGLVYQMPENANPSKQPVSLHSLLHQTLDVVLGFRRPSLEERLSLAQQVANSIFSFALVRWFHKDFNCRNIIFFRDTSPGAKIMLDSPYITGFSISRPDSEGEKSLNKDLEALSIYLHPDLRVSDPNKRPAYHRKYDIYSLGLLLFEIGIWNSIDHVAKSTLDPTVFKKAVVHRCEKDLPFFVGERFRDVVVRCLTCGDEDADESSSSLDTLYWSVVLELAKCR